MVTQDEIIDMLLKSRDLVLIDRQAHVRLADRIKAHGIAPPDGYVLVPVEKLESWRIALSQGDLDPRWQLEAMLSAVKEKDNEQ